MAAGAVASPVASVSGAVSGEMVWLPILVPASSALSALLRASTARV